MNRWHGVSLADREKALRVLAKMHGEADSNVDRFFYVTHRNAAHFSGSARTDYLNHRLEAFERIFGRATP